MCKSKKIRNFAFFESYFSNYIEGTEFSIEDAHTIISTGRPLPMRNDDSHDVLGTYAIVSNKVEMQRVPGSAEEFIRMLQAREAALLGVPSYYLGIRYSMPANAAASKVASLQNQRTMSFEAWIHEYIEDKPKKEITKNTESTVADSNLQDLASQSACMQASRQLDNQVPATDADAHHLCDSLQKNVICDNSQKNVSSDDTSKNGHAGENVIEQRMRQQQELRARIDAEFIDINQYMLDLIEGKQKQ